MVQPNPAIPFNYPIWLNPNFQWPPAERGDLILASVGFGFVLGFGLLTCRNAYRQISAMRNPVKSMYAWMVVGQILSDFLLATMVFLLLIGTIMPSFWVWFFMLCIWVPQTQLIAQILCNRCAMIEVDRNRARMVKIWTLALVGIINISVFCIWIPARMQISARYINVNNIWDRITKVMLLFIDLFLNIYFIRSVKSKLVNNGLQKYSKLVRFNMRIIIISISLDVALIGTMSLNGVVYGIVQCVMYIIKLNIELSLSALIILIAKEKDVDVWLSDAERSRELPRSATLGRSTFRSVGSLASRNRSEIGDVNEIIDLQRPRTMSLAKPTLAYRGAEDVVVNISVAVDQESSQGSINDVERNGRSSDDYPLTEERWEERDYANKSTVRSQVQRV